MRRVGWLGGLPKTDMDCRLFWTSGCGLAKGQYLRTLGVHLHLLSSSASASFSSRVTKPLRVQPPTHSPFNIHRSLRASCQATLRALPTRPSRGSFPLNFVCSDVARPAADYMPFRNPMLRESRRFGSIHQLLQRSKYTKFLWQRFISTIGQDQEAVVSLRKYRSNDEAPAFLPPAFLFSYTTDRRAV